MPTDVEPTDVVSDAGTGQAPPVDRHRGMRLAVGVASVFVLAMLFQWPFGFLAAVFAGLFLQAPTPPSARAGITLVIVALVLLTAGFVVFTVLLPYPVIFLIAVAAMVVWGFSLSVAGKSPLLVVLALMEALMMPYLTTVSMDVALAMVFWFPINMALALLTAWSAFAVFPPVKRAVVAAELAAAAGPVFDPDRRLLRMTLVTLPFALVFFLVDAGAVLTLLFVAILSQQLAASTATGTRVAKGMLFANLVGGIVAILAYEVIVIATAWPVLIAITFLVCVGFGRWFESGRADAGLAGSALSTAIILLGGAMAPFSEDADVKMVDRLVQVGAALIWVLTAFVVVDRFLPEREKPADLPSWKRKRRRGRGRGSTRPELPV
ncbi:Protein of unknown function (DUF2955) [Aliiruegeria haliotis]|uniref:DUF2955 domain-containing protein n=1 Tax=Aliiruegeria haliotis TaxID=1280846 RepID=A0A2T0RZF5_9RHOB|nr:DUF2955 domain-containing protein [Aliiruegeria haliotis]PRY26558.1 Protein of unknown function (DUF2955) [Aliiruegeria haliotis]